MTDRPLDLHDLQGPTSHVCEDRCLHDCPECGHEVDHTGAFHSPQCSTPFTAAELEEAAQRRRDADDLASGRLDGYAEELIRERRAIG